MSAWFCSFNADELGNIEVRVGNIPITSSVISYQKNALCGTVGNTADQPFDVTCGSGVTGRYVSVQRFGGSASYPIYFILCEVQVRLLRMETTRTTKVNELALTMVLSARFLMNHINDVVL